MQRWGDQPSAAASALYFSLRPLHFSPKTKRPTAVVLRLRLTSKVLLSARHRELVYVTCAYFLGPDTHTHCDRVECSAPDPARKTSISR